MLESRSEVLIVKVRPKSFSTHRDRRSILQFRSTRQSNQVIFVDATQNFEMSRIGNPDGDIPPSKMTLIDYKDVVLVRFRSYGAARDSQRIVFLCRPNPNA